MNELESIRKAFPETDGPSPEAAAAARRQVEALIREFPEQNLHGATISGKQHARGGWGPQ
ncbi:hypothetical protein EV646_110265 [Kribbella antiqua]|uniref:Uncharacterized protein n=1 Tax=Kribbella antiqua TaxID=2512217 RepID=A0A4R2IHW7_9ACTN|nr:hypothetical protein [Kribbella antiqua]TCO44551.1 hypothetical protein EV646_110265 [Kribbella antiqua]